MSDTSSSAVAEEPGHPEPGSVARLSFEARPPLQARTVSARVSLRTRLREIVGARELLVFLVRKELKVKYKGSVLGLLWSMLNPAVTLLVYYVVFKYFLKASAPSFALYLFSGMIVWNFFLTALIGAASTIVANAGIVKKVSFPREILALAQIGTSGMFFLFQSVVLVIFLVGFQYTPAWGWMPLIPFALVDLLLFTSALAIFLSAVNVYLRDIEHLVAVLLNAWFWGVPIIYSFNQVYGHKSLHWLGELYLFDPMTVIILTFQRAIYGKVSYRTYDAATHTFKTTVWLANYPYHFYLFMLGCVLVASVLLLLGAMLVFGRIEGNFAEEL
ncbi:MAG TPA: ABC transporter permease [Acidimicrobiales bacterium]|nr:ABC transporter permease [Acidimicrobiales bacterium]